MISTVAVCFSLLSAGPEFCLKPGSDTIQSIGGFKHALCRRRALVRVRVRVGSESRSVTSHLALQHSFTWEQHLCAGAFR